MGQANMVSMFGRGRVLALFGALALGCVADTPAPDELSPELVACEDGVQLAPTPGLVRLSHVQYDNVIRDLLGVSGKSAGFIDDPSFGGYDNNAAGLQVSDRLARDYRRAAEEAAEEVVTDDALLAAIVPCELETDDACVSTYVGELGRRAYRRPLTAGELAAYVDLHRSAFGLYETGTPSEQGVRLVIEAMLQSPMFLWRIELANDGEAEDDLVPLDGFEMASRLSFFLWNTMPDDELLAAAAAGELDGADGIEAQARRLLEDPRARATVRDFHRQWLALDGYEDLSKDPELYPDWDPTIAPALTEETQRFIEHVIFELEGDYADLFSAPFSFIDADLARAYGIEGEFGSEPELHFFGSDDPRGGLLTQIGFLAANAHADTSSPIQRGVFVQRRIMCTQLPDPPADANLDLPEIDGEDIETTREQVEAHTADDRCQGCHALINPAGFAFEHFDAIGRFRSTENGHPIDASGSFVASPGHTLTFDGALELSYEIAASEDAHECYLRNWFRYGFGRLETPEDRCTVDSLHVELEDAGYDVHELLVALTRTVAFRHRARTDEMG